MRELELIERLAAGLAPRGGTGATVVRWLGDDAAVVRGRGYAVTSVDTVVDGVHFRSGQLTPAEIGHRALGSALSDLAAMGARAGEAYLALCLPAGTELEDAVALLTGAGGRRRRAGAARGAGGTWDSRPPRARRAARALCPAPSAAGGGAGVERPGCHRDDRPV